MDFLLLAVVGIFGGLLAQKIKIPAGFLIGSLLASSFVAYFLPEFNLPPFLRTAVQIAAGAFLGADITSRDIKALKSLIFPAFLLVFGMIALNLVLGFTLHWFGGLDLATALLATAPGGVTEMSLVAASLGGSPGLVAMIQLFRFLIVMSLSPLMLRQVCKNNKAEPDEVSSTTIDLPGLGEKGLGKKRRILLTSVIGLGGGLIGAMLPIPAGALTFSLMGVAALNVTKNLGQVFTLQRPVIQILAGILIGVKFPLGDFLLLGDFILLGPFLILGMLALNLMIGFFISRLSKLDLPTALFASAPGGMSDMALISKDYGADQTKVVILQMLRLLSVILIFPTLIATLVLGINS